MKNPRLPLFLLGALTPLLSVCLPLARAADPATAPLQDIPVIPIVLKVDDLAATATGGNVSEKWIRITDFARERKIKLSIGIIVQSLATADPAYADYIKNFQKTGLVEFWFHGWDHKIWDENGKKIQEFKGTSYEQQKDHFVKSQALVKEKLGFVFTTFGSPFNGMDDNTFKVFAEDPDMKVFLYAWPADQAKIPGRVILDRVGEVNIEAPLFKPNAAKFIEGYLKNAKGRHYYVVQGHPNEWDADGWSEFVKIVDFLQQNHIPIITPTEAAPLLKSHL